MYRNQKINAKAAVLALGIIFCIGSLSAQSYYQQSGARAAYPVQVNGNPAQNSQGSTNDRNYYTNGQASFGNNEKVVSNAPANINESQLKNSVKQQNEIERQAKEAEEQIKRNIIPDAAAVIEGIKNAQRFIREGKDNEALSAIEKAMGKIDLLLSRNPHSALLPVDFDIDVIDSAPLKSDNINKIVSVIDKAIREKDYPDARLLLDDLRSEINIETYAIPLGFYPAALKRAAGLLERKASGEAAEVLKGALDSLVIISQTIPIPLINASTFLSIAEESLSQNNQGPLAQILDDANSELQRARDLGYVSRSDGEYTSLADAIKDLQKEVKANTSNPSKFQVLKERFKAFLKRHFEKKKTSEESQNIRS